MFDHILFCKKVSFYPLLITHWQCTYKSSRYLIVSFIWIQFTTLMLRKHYILYLKMQTSDIHKKANVCQQRAIMVHLLMFTTAGQTKCDYIIAFTEFVNHEILCFCPQMNTISQQSQTNRDANDSPHILDKVPSQGTGGGGGRETSVF